MEGVNIKIDYYPKNNNIVIIKLSGYIDQSNSHELEGLIHDLLHSGKKHLVFDLDQLVYMSSAGWGVFVGEIKNVRNVGGDIKVAAMSPEVYDVFQVLEFYHIFEDYAKVEEAIYSFLHTDFGGVIELDNDESEILEKKGAIQAGKIYEISDDDKADNNPADTETDQASIGFNNSAAPAVKMEISRSDQETGIDITTLPAVEKARRIITVYPILSIWQIRKMMRHKKFGNTKIGIIKLYKILKENNLHTKKLRYRYFRSV